MKIDLTNNHQDTEIEIVFGAEGAYVYYDNSEDVGAFSISDGGVVDVPVSLGDLDRLIEALSLLKEKIDDY